MIDLSCQDAFEAALADLRGPDLAMIEAAGQRQAELTKPVGSLGRLEEIATFMAGWQGGARPQLDHVQAIVFAGDHGVAARGISAFPPEVTQQMVANFRNGGAAINALTEACGAELHVVDLSVDGPTGDISETAAMTQAECLAAIAAGAAAVDSRANLLIVGEMGIGNTTPASAICAQAFGERAAAWVGRGSGVDMDGLNRKRQTVDDALSRHNAHCTSSFETLRRLGGREIAAMAGAILTARHRGIPVLLDGFICCAAIVPLALANPAFTDHCLAAHCSGESAHGSLLERLRLRPLLNLDMRLGEGTGAAVAVQIVRSALAVHNGMATFAEASVSGAE